ncbi:hypothetical protein BLA60_33010 [Actinophytocola xinjiangensis]|uniref:Methyltransferase domain-containing protein n=1 Tax=Actinophytocola xinjiangensis TaxID=485602 RepID=A0A7Z0WGA0_9PSEU|nr:class I SAM-dependent methyltransferase [Actinophytocola xinjiangensis]OLF06158.1 hypothetical protein BLA60_33010 [Actinophytocola xinjiangensis]
MDPRHLELLSRLDGPWVEDPLLLRSAELMRQVALERCSSDGRESTDGCRSYHAWWQYWRAIGLVSTPDWHVANYADVFAGDRDARVLVSGTADHGVLRHLAQAGARGPIAVLDLCPTPLEMCSWYASEHLPGPLSTHRADVLAAPFGEAEFDLITTYAFLSRFPDPVKERVVAGWRAMLRPGGRVLTTIRLEPEVPMSVPELDELSPRLLAAVDDGDPGILHEVAAAYVRSGSTSHPLRSVEHAHELFAGFDVTVEIGVLRNRFYEDRDYAVISARL